MPNYYWHAPSGEYRPSKPIPYAGWKARLEQWFRSKGFKKLANFMGDWDERGLGR